MNNSGTEEAMKMRVGSFWYSLSFYSPKLSNVVVFIHHCCSVLSSSFCMSLHHICDLL